jgi:hypothetical protein
MQTLVIDTNGIIKKLERRGFSPAQAEGITEALKELHTAALITKSDLECTRPSDCNHHQVGNGYTCRPRR